MTVRELLTDRVRFIRLPQWEPRAHIELPLLADGGHGPWATVRDVSGETKVFLFTLLDDAENQFVAAPHPARTEEP